MKKREMTVYRDRGNGGTWRDQLGMVAEEATGYNGYGKFAVA